MSLQDQINAAPVGGVVQIPAGTTALTSPLQITQSVALVGNDMALSVLTIPNGQSAININPASANIQVKLEGFSIYYPSLAGVDDPPAIQFGNASFNHAQSLIRRVAIFYASKAIMMLNGINPTVEDCLIQYYSNTGILISNPLAPDSGGAIVTNNQIINDGVAAPEACPIVWFSGGGFDISHNKLLSGWAGFYMVMQGQTTEGKFNDNLVAGMTLAGVSLNPAGAFDFYEMDINGNTFDSCAQALAVPAGSRSWMHNLSFNNNGVSAPYNFSGNQVELHGVDVFTVEGNRFHSNGTGGTPVPVYIDAASNGCVGGNARGGPVAWAPNTILSSAVATFGTG